MSPVAGQNPESIVRPARAGDAHAIAEVQVETWQTCYAPRLPAGALDQLHVTTVEAGWRAAVTAPPSGQHRLLVAVAAMRVCGYVAFGPAEDGDARPTDGEIYALTVAPADQSMGHGSRLLTAAVDLLGEDGFEVARTWMFDGDTALQAFLGEAGWAPDGATRVLDMGEPVGQQRWHTALPGR